jgi:hypothetical protein
MLNERIPFRIFLADLTAIIVTSSQLLSDDALISITLSTANM